VQSAGRDARPTVTVRFFSTAQDAAGTASQEIGLEASDTVETLVARLCAMHPRLAPMRASLLVAVNFEYAAGAQPLSAGDEIALIPPVQGG
jgi:molybdopterin converting factor subunit 1